MVFATFLDHFHTMLMANENGFDSDRKWLSETAGCVCRLLFFPTKNETDTTGMRLSGSRSFASQPPRADFESGGTRSRFDFQLWQVEFRFYEERHLSGTHLRLVTRQVLQCAHGIESGLLSGMRLRPSDKCSDALGESPEHTNALVMYAALPNR